MLARILVVEDEPGVRAIVVRALEGEGYAVKAVADGAAGLDAALNESFDLIVSDDRMPRLSGDELALRIRDHRPRLPILHMSGWPDAGADHPGEHYLYKPFSPEALIRAVHDLLEKPRQR